MVTETLKSATREGVKLAYLDTGAGDPPLVFIHGWCCDHTYWRDQIPEFAERHRVVAFDLRGLGESDKPDEDSTIAQFADDVAWLAREIGLSKPVLIGHSMGGVIALNILRRHPGLARAAIFNDSPMLPFPEPLRLQLDGLFEGLRSPAYKDVAANFVRAFLFNAESPAGMADEVVKGMTGAPQRLMHTAIADMLSEESIAAGAIPVPSLFVRAATQIATEEQLKARYPGMEVTTVNCAHFIQMEKPAEFNAIVSRFLEKVA